MVSFDTIATISLIIILAITVYLNKKKLSFHKFGIFYVAMYRTKAGLRTMDKLAKKHKKWLIKLTPWIIGLGFVGMALVTFDLARGLLMILMGGVTPAVGLVLPVKAKGIFYVPFLYWIISIFVILIIHEGSHGVMARAYNLPVKNSGLVVLGALIPIIPGAFVEPDEKKLGKASKKKQLAVFAAGPVSNLVTGLMLMLLMFTVITPFTNSFYGNNGVVVTDLMDGNTPAEQAGIAPGDKIVSINGNQITGTVDFSDSLKDSSPGDTVSVITSNAVFDVTLGENPQNDKALLGVYVDNALAATAWYVKPVLWIKGLVFWLYLLSLGVGLFNLIPLGPVDGGRMFLTGMQPWVKQHRANKIWKSVSFFVLGVLLTHIILAFV